MGSNDNRSSPQLKKFPKRLLVRVLGAVVLAVAVGWVVFATAGDASSSGPAPVAAAAQPAQAAFGAQVGSPAPEFQLATLAGQNVTLAGFRGKPLVVNFFASWCDPCKLETPIVKTLADSASTGGYAVLGIAVNDERASLNQFVADEGLTMPVSMDTGNEAAHAFGVIGPPTTFFIDGAGVVRDIVMGPLNSDRVAQGLSAARDAGGTQSPVGADSPLLAALVLALGAGLLSFLSPCVLPLLPAYMGYIGLSSETVSQQGAGASRLPVLMKTAAFVLGLVAVFAALGFSASFIGSWLTAYRTLLARLGGLLVLVFGLHMLRVLPIPFLYQEYRPAMGLRRFNFGGGLLSAGMLGAAFGIGWTPCVGPMLGTILLIAGQAGKAGTGVSLLMAYGVGLGIPFLLAGLAFSQALGAVAALKRHFGLIEKISGALLIATAVFLMSGSLSALTLWFQRVL